MSELGLTASSTRNIKTIDAYRHLIPGIGQLQRTDEFVTMNGNVVDTVNYMKSIVRDYHHQVKKLALHLKSSDLKKTLNNVWDFVYNHVQYVRDDARFEQLRTPLRTIHDAKGDCDDMSTLAAALLYNLGIPFKFRITKYWKPNFQHIYVIVPHNGREYIIDAVLDAYNTEKPYSEKKDFHMQQIEGLAGMPIQLLNGADSNFYMDIVELATGTNLENASVQGLGAITDELYNYLVKTRNAIATKPDDFKQYQNPAELIRMLDYAIKYWNTPQRDQALAVLEKEEQKLLEQGAILFPDGLTGIDEEDDFDNDLDGLDGWELDTDYTGVEPELAGVEYKYIEPQWEPDENFVGNIGDNEDPNYLYAYSNDGFGRIFRTKKQRKARRAKRKAKRAEVRRTKGGFFKRVGTAVKTGAKKAVKAVVRYNPATATIRGGILAWLKLNVGKSSDKLKYGYLTEAQARALNLNLDEWRKSVDALNKVKKLFAKTLQGKESNLRKAILHKGRGKSIGLGQLGVEPVSTTAVAATASPFIIKIASWLSKVGLDKMANKMVTKSATKNAIKAQGGDGWRKTWRAAKKELRKGDASSATNIIDTAKQVYNQVAPGAPTSTPETVMPTPTATASILPTNIMGKVQNFVKENPLQAAAIGFSVALIASPGLRRAVSNAVGVTPQKIRKANPSAPALSGTPARKSNKSTGKRRVRKFKLN